MPLQDVQQAFYGMCIEAGRRVLDVMMKADREALCGPKGVPDAQRRAVRGGHTSRGVVLGGQCIDIRRPRAHALDAGEYGYRLYCTGADEFVLVGDAYFAREVPDQAFEM